MLHLLPNAPDFTRCDPIRKYRLGPFLCVLVKEPKAIANRITPNLSAIEFIYAMIFVHDERDVRLIVTSERTANSSLIALNRMMGGDTDGSKAFLCIFRRDGSRENLGKFEGLDNENVFSKISLELCAKEFDLQGSTAQLIHGLVQDDHLAGSGTLRIESSPSESEIEEQSDIEEDETEEIDEAEDSPGHETSSNQWHPAEMVEDLRADGEITEAAQLQGRLDSLRSHALMLTIWQLEAYGTGNVDNDLRKLVEEMRADGDVRGAFCLQQSINARQDARILSRFSELIETEGDRLKRLQRQLYAAEAKDNFTEMKSILEEQVSIYRNVCPSSISAEEFNEESLAEKLDELREYAEHARADGDIAQAIRIQKEIDNLTSWVVAAELQCYLYHSSLAERLGNG